MEFHLIGLSKAKLSKKVVSESLKFIFKNLKSQQTTYTLSLRSKDSSSDYSKKKAKQKSKKQIEKNFLKLEQKKSLTVIFLSEKSIQELNFKFRGKNKPTDILSFAPTEKESLGELALYCDPKRASRLELTVREETFYLLLHGVLHLLDFNHEKEPQASQMYAIQDTIFQQWNQRNKKS